MPWACASRTNPSRSSRSPSRRDACVEQRQPQHGRGRLADDFQRDPSAHRVPGQRKLRRRDGQYMRSHLRDAVEPCEIHHLHIRQIAQRGTLQLPDGGVA
ncbi:hypothetical protein DXO165_06335 [Xanthomonas oryzae pv. oryzae]|nr:hypothetical protein DXO165_06335 [Xanthomonas oryzae pv. oryzae]